MGTHRVEGDSLLEIYGVIREVVMFGANELTKPFDPKTTTTYDPIDPKRLPLHLYEPPTLPSIIIN